VPLSHLCNIETLEFSIKFIKQFSSIAQEDDFNHGSKLNLHQRWSWCKHEDKTAANYRLKF
jgi:hypothetical protein